MSSCTAIVAGHCEAPEGPAQLQESTRRSGPPQGLILMASQYEDTLIMVLLSTMHLRQKEHHLSNMAYDVVDIVQNTPKAYSS